MNVAGFMLHSAIHAARPDIKCIIHLHLPNIVAVSKPQTRMYMKISLPKPIYPASWGSTDL